MGVEPLSKVADIDELFALLVLVDRHTRYLAHVDVVLRLNLAHPLRALLDVRLAPHLNQLFIRLVFTGPQPVVDFAFVLPLSRQLLDLLLTVGVQRL